MTRQELEVFISSVQSAFQTGDVDLLLGFVRLPLVIYTPVGIVVLRNAEEFATITTDYRAALTAMSVTSGRPRVLGFDPLANSRLRVRVRTVEKDLDDNAIASSTVHYFLVRTEMGLVIEMMEFLEAPLSIPDIEKIVH